MTIILCPSFPKPGMTNWSLDTLAPFDSSGSSGVYHMPMSTLTIPLYWMRLLNLTPWSLSNPGQRWVCIQMGDPTAGPLVWSELSGAEHTQDRGDDSGLQEKPPYTPPLTILNSTVDTFRFLGTTISWNLRWSYHIDTVWKKAHHRRYVLLEVQPLKEKMS